MCRANLFVLSLFAALLALPATALAGLPIPCTGEAVIKVLDVPALKGLEIQANRGQREKRLDLGYKYTGCFSGTWVGYLGSNRSYLTLNENQLKMLLAAAGLQQPPAEPGFWSAPFSVQWPVFLWGVVIGFVVVGSVLSSYAQRHAPAPHPEADLPDAPGLHTPVSPAAATRNAHPSQPAGGAAPRPAAPAPRRVSVPARVHAQGAVRSGFGRRA